MTITNSPSAPGAESTLAERYAAVRRRIHDAALRSGRSGDDVLLVAVTKYASIDQVRKLVDLGGVDLGENKVQALLQRSAQIDEFLERRRELPGARIPGEGPTSVRWHMIGGVQRNKVKKLLPAVRLIHTVDSLRLAEEIQTQAMKFDEPVEALVQLNLTNETQKRGVAPAAARHLVEQIDTMVNIRPRGLMCMGVHDEDPFASREIFQLCKEIFDDIRRVGVGGDRFNILSMGMSNDFELAIECGSNLVRVGSAIFGPREHDADDGDDE